MLKADKHEIHWIFPRLELEVKVFGKDMLFLHLCSSGTLEIRHQINCQKTSQMCLLNILGVCICRPLTNLHHKVKQSKDCM